MIDTNRIYRNLYFEQSPEDIQDILAMHWDKTGKEIALQASGDVSMLCQRRLEDPYEPVLDLWIEDFNDPIYSEITEIEAFVTIEK